MSADIIKQPLGIGTLFAGTFGLFFRHFLLFALIGIVPSMVLSGLLLIVAPTLSDPNSYLEPMFIVSPTYLGSVFGSVLMLMFTTAVVTLAAYDVKLGKPAQIGAYVGRTLRAFVPLVVLSFVFYVFFMLGFMLLVLPGLYLIGRYMVMTPAILVDGAGFRGLSRAAELTKGYRWPILGVVILMLVAISLGSMAVYLPFVGIEGMLAAADPNNPGFLLQYFINAAASGLQYALWAILTALVYARLRQIKEGLGFEDLVKVFE